MEIIEPLFPEFFEKQPLTALAILFPLYCIISGISSVMTWQLVLAKNKKTHPDLRLFLKDLSPILIKLSLAVLLSGIFVILGMSVFILPGIFFLSLFLFVPFLIAEDATRPIEHYLRESQRLAFRELTGVIFLVLIMIGGSLLSWLGGDALADLIERTVQGPYGFVIALATKVLVAIPFGALIDLSSAYYFIQLRSQK